MNISLHFSPAAFKKKLYAFLHRFHILLFVIVVLGGLAIVILLLNQTIISSGEPTDYTPPTNSTGFDQATIKRIEELKTRDQGNADLDLSAGRTNPFVE